MPETSDSLKFQTLLRVWFTERLRPIAQWAFVVCELTAFLVAVVPLIPITPDFLSDVLTLRVAVACASFGVLIVAVFNILDDDRIFSPLQSHQLGILAGSVGKQIARVYFRELYIQQYPEPVREELRKRMAISDEEAPSSGADRRGDRD